MSASARCGRRARGDSGAILVEAAFVLPILLGVLLSLMDFAIWEFQTSQASSAARDGARVGILLPLDSANQSTTKAAIDAAVKARIPGANELTSFVVNVYCTGGSKGVDFSGCSNATPGTTQLFVVASWRYNPLSPLGMAFGKPTISSTAGMVYVGARTGGTITPPALCDVLTGAPTIPTLSGSTLAGDLILPFTTNLAADCGNWTAQLLDSNEDSTGTGAVSVSAANGQVTFTPANVSGLSPGVYTIRLATLTRQWDVDVTLVAPAACGVTFGSPTVPTLSGTSLSGTLTAPFTTNGSPACSGLSATLRDASNVSKGTGTVSLTGSDGSATFTPGQVSGLTAGTYTVTLTDGSNTWTVNVGLTACSATVSASPGALTLSGQNLSGAVTATITSSNCSGSFTVQLVRMTGVNLFHVYQTQTKTIPASATTFSRLKSANDTNSDSFITGEYRVFVSGGGLPSSGVYSNAITVS